MLKKESQGKRKKSAKMAGFNKFLRIYTHEFPLCTAKQRSRLKLLFLPHEFVGGDLI
jgi:hypothetical protein